ncbi:MAG: glycosyltransferase family 2 protein [Planctomycetes bacterium]|nr:glycosyltransferase family 2 protein [Planctomycetota bacterium]
MIKDELDLSVIIISYNTRKLTLECLESLYKETTNVNFETILVDNASDDDSVSAVKEEYPQVRVIALKENIGFARANNLACESACGKYLLLLNPDTIIINNATENILVFAQQNQEAGIWGGRTIFPDGSLNTTSCYGEMTPWSLFCRAFGLTAIFPNSSLFNSECFGSWQYDSVRQVSIVTGCFMLIRTSLWKQLEGFDPLFFMYGEEVDFCIRAKKLGYKPMFSPAAEIIHYGGASEKSKMVRSEKVFRAKATIIRKNWPKRSVGFGIWMLLLWVASRAVIMKIVSVVATKKHTAQREKWFHVWRKRKEWRKGFCHSYQPSMNLPDE